MVNLYFCFEMGSHCESLAGTCYTKTDLSWLISIVRLLEYAVPMETPLGTSDLTAQRRLNCTKKTHAEHGEHHLWWFKGEMPHLGSGMWILSPWFGTTLKKEDVCPWRHTLRVHSLTPVPQPQMCLRTKIWSLSIPLKLPSELSLWDLL